MALDLTLSDSFIMERTDWTTLLWKLYTIMIVFCLALITQHNTVKMINIDCFSEGADKIIMASADTDWAACSAGPGCSTQ